MKYNHKRLSVWKEYKSVLSILVLLFALTSCRSTALPPWALLPPQEQTYTVRFDLGLPDGYESIGFSLESEIKDMTIKEGSIIEKPANPDLAYANGGSSIDIEFRGWYLEDGTPAVFPMTVNENVTLYASWGTLTTSSDGTKTHLVFNEEGLKAWAKAVESGDNPNCTLLCDIMLSDPAAEGARNWTPVSSYSGTFDGQGHAISNMIINGTDEDVGLFGELSLGAIVRDVVLKDSEISQSGNENVGGIAGVNQGTIIGCKVIDVEISNSDKGTGTGTGGIVGVNGAGNGGQVIGCTFSGVVTFESIHGGGIVGINYGEIVACHSKGSIKASDTIKSSNTGGIAGHNYTGLIIACYSTATITGEKAGVITGYSSGEEVRQESCYYSGTINGTGNMGDDEAGTIKVDGSSVVWSGKGATIAMDKMNRAINEWTESLDNVCPYRYTAVGASENVPLVLENTSGGS